MLMIPPPPTVPQHGKVGVKEGDVQRHMENGMEGERKGYDSHFCPPPHKMSLSVTRLPRLPRSPLWKWNPHLNTHDDI